MPYATPDKLLDLYGAADLSLLTGQAEGTDAFNEALQGACANADDEVDGYLVDAVTLPLAPERVPAGLRLHACRMAYYHLHRDRATAKAEKDYDTAVRFLERVQLGKAGLGFAPESGTEVPQEGGVGALHGPPGGLGTDALNRFLS